MTKEQPLWHRMYFNPVYTDVVRAVGYEGMTYREWSQKLQELIEKHGQQAESVSWHLLYFEGQMTTNPKPLAKVELRKEVRKLAWGLLGVPKDHPEYELYQKPEPLPFFRAPKQEEPQQEPKKQTRKKKAG